MSGYTSRENNCPGWKVRIRENDPDEFISRLPDGYETILGENGAGLSGSRRQRIAIARAFLKNAPVLLLDEATSAPDTKTEKDIQQALNRLSMGKTIFVIAHRVTAIQNADCIYYPENGKIADRGKHEELLNHCKNYAVLCGETQV